MMVMYGNYLILGIEWLNEPLAAEYLEFIAIDTVTGTFGRKLIKSLSDATDCVSKYRQSSAYTVL